MVATIRDRNSQQLIAQGRVEDGSLLELEGNWYFAPEAVDMTYLVETERTYTCPYKGVCNWIDLDSPDTKARNIGFVYRITRDGYENINGRIAFYSRSTNGTLAAEEEDVRS